MLCSFIKKICSRQPRYERDIQRFLEKGFQPQAIVKPAYIAQLQALMQEIPEDDFEHVYVQHQSEVILSYYPSHLQLSEALEDAIKMIRKNQGVIAVNPPVHPAPALWRFVLTEETHRGKLKDIVMELLSQCHTLLTEMSIIDAKRKGYDEFYKKLKEIIVSTLNLVHAVVTWFHVLYQQRE